MTVNTPRVTISRQYLDSDLNLVRVLKPAILEGALGLCLSRILRRGGYSYTYIDGVNKFNAHGWAVKSKPMPSLVATSRFIDVRYSSMLAATAHGSEWGNATDVWLQYMSSAGD
jgi:hypothetical protein